MGTPIQFGVDNDQNIIVKLTYDAAGRVTSQRDPRGSLTTYEYDQLNRRTSLTNALDQAWTSAYGDTPDGGTSLTMTYPNGYSVAREMDALGRLMQINYGQPGVTPDVQFTYDLAGNRTGMAEYSGAGFTTPIRQTQFAYDDARRLAAVAFDTDGDGTPEEAVSYAYDAGGLRTRLTLPGNLNVTYRYNARGQLISLTNWDDQTTDLAYDDAGRMIAAQRDNGLRSRYGYDAGGRLRLLRHTAGGRTLGHFAYEVDARGNRTQALEALAHPTTTDETTIAHDDAGLVARGAWANASGFRTTTDFGAALWLLFMGDDATLTMGVGPDHGIYDVYVGRSLWRSIDGYAASAGQVDVPLALSHDGPHLIEVRNRAAKNRASSGLKVRFKQLVVPNRTDTVRTMTYEYDGLSRLLEACSAPGMNADALDADLLRRDVYTYDVAGNRLSQAVALDGGTAVTTSYTYNAANQLTSDGTHPLLYDANGNLTNDGVNAYTWDRANRLLSMGGASYAYDGAGNRVKQTVGTDVTKYLLDVQPGLAVVLSATTGSDTTRYVHSLHGIHAQQDSAGAWDWMVQDGLGSVRGVVDNALAVQESQLYAPYGEPYEVTGTNQTMYGFTGEPTDANELVYLRARYLNAGLGVFASLDPFEGMARRPMSLNGYSWVEGNPTNWIDPTGELAFFGVLAAILLGGAIGGTTYGVLSQTMNGVDVGCIDANQVLMSTGAGLTIGAGLAVAFWLGAGGTLGTLTASQIAGGTAAASGAATNVIGQGIIGTYSGAASLEELVARLSVDMAIGGVFGRIWAGVLNQIPLSGSRYMMNHIPPLVARGAATGTINTVQGVIQRWTRSDVFGDTDVEPLTGQDVLGDLAWGFGLSLLPDLYILRSTRGGNLTVQRGGYIIRPPVPNVAGNATRSGNLSRFSNLLPNQILFTITGTNIAPNALSDPQQFLINLFNDDQ